jgi:hypothetical protein
VDGVVPVTTCFAVDFLQVTFVMTALSLAAVPLSPSASVAMQAFDVHGADDATAAALGAEDGALGGAPDQGGALSVTKTSVNSVSRIPAKPLPGL